MSENTYLGWSVTWIEQWSQFFSQCNWYTFHPIKIEIEDERNMGGIEMTLIVMGLGFCVRYNYAETEMLESLRKQIRDLEARDAS